MTELRHQMVDRLKVLTPMSARNWLVHRRLAVRQLTAEVRTLPDFLIIGAQRCGTSSLYKYLGRHPDLAPSLRKEVGFFSDHYAKGESWYRSHFPVHARKVLHLRRSGVSLQTFEATPDYMLDIRSPRRAAELLPNIRIIVLLRNPIDRAYSHYRHMCRLGLESLTFEEALRAEADRISLDQERLLVDANHQGKALLRYSYFERGKYAIQLRRWYARYPKGRILVIRSEDFFHDQTQTLFGIADFLGVRRWAPAHLRNYSYVGLVETREKMAAAAREQLAVRFHPYILDLEALIGTRMDWEC